MAEIKVKAVIDKEKKRVLFVESNADFVDLLFSFLTMPMGTIIRLTEERPLPITIGSMNNLYKSVENLSEKCFRTGECRDMLLSPRNGAEAYLKSIKLWLENYNHFFSPIGICLIALKQMSYYKRTLCPCGKYMNHPTCLGELASEDDDGGVFVKGSNRYIVSDDLLIFPLSTATSFSLLSKQDVTIVNTIEEIDFLLGKNEILNLLKNLFTPKDALTKTLLKNIPINIEPNEEICDDRCTKKRKITPSSGDEQHISVKLFVSKSRNVVCFAEASEDFVGLLFSFLTIPLGKIMKEHGGDGPFAGCARHLHESVQKLDATNLISDEIRQFLVCPKVAPHFGVHKELLGVEETVTQYFCTVQGGTIQLTADKSRLEYHDWGYDIHELTLLDPKSSCDSKGNKTSGGYVKGPTMFTITDDLVIKTSSATSGVAILDKMNIHFNDIEERTVNVGKEEAR